MALTEIPLDMDTRAIAAEARAFCRQKGVSVGRRGRLSTDQFVTFFLSNPAKAREVARQAKIPVSRRGRISPVDAAKVALLVR